MRTCAAPDNLKQVTCGSRCALRSIIHEEDDPGTKGPLKIVLLKVLIKKLFNARNHNSNKPNNEQTAIQPQNATTKANAWNFIAKYSFENYDRNNIKITRRD